LFAVEGDVEDSLRDSALSDPVDPAYQPK
jgi:hypothetical protein